MQPSTRYARSGDVNIAYQVVGDGPIDLVFVMGWVSNLDYFWEEPRFARFLRRLAGFSRLILFDKRGTGLSDRVPVSELPSLEQRMDDVRAVMDAVGSERAAVVGVSEGGSMSVLFAATHPQRTSALVLLGCFPRRLWAPDYPWGPTPEELQGSNQSLLADWGSPQWAAVDLQRRAPSMAGDELFQRWWGTYIRMSASPGAAMAVRQMNSPIDVRHVLRAIRVPTLVVHRTGDRTVPVQAGRYMAERIPGARYVEIPGEDHLPFVGDQDAILAEIEEFLTGERPAAEPDTVLATLLVTDVIGSAPGDDRPGALDEYRSLVRKEAGRFRGSVIETGGERILAAFDGPARAVHCACALADAARSLGLQVRAGLHTGECELVGDRVSGLAVHLAARVLEQAGPGDVLASGTVRDLTAGSGFQFEDLGSHALAGIQEEWRLFRVDRGARPAEAAPHAGTRAAGSSASGRAARLTAREREVALLLARGLSNRQVAEELVITEATAERHVANILNKRGFHSRAQIAVWVVEQDLARARPD